MITSLHLGNFKAFADTQRIPIRPITLIFGPNSSGKSSLIHSLLLAHDALHKGDLDIHRTILGEDCVDLGGFRQFIHKRQVANRMEWGVELDASKFQGRVAELLAPLQKVTISTSLGMILDDKGIPIPYSLPNVMSYEISGDKTSLLRMSRRNDGTLKLDRLDHEHPVFREIIKAIVLSNTTTETISPLDYEGLDKAINDLAPEISVRIEKFLPDGLIKVDKIFDQERQETLFPISQGNRAEGLKSAMRFYLPRIIDELVRCLTQSVKEEINRLVYLGPLRSNPPRHLAFSGHHDPNWHAGGGFAWDTVRKNAIVRNSINAWLSSPNRLQTPYELVIRHLIDPESDQAHSQIWDGLDDIISLMFSERQSHADSGYGGGSGSGSGFADGAGYGGGSESGSEFDKKKYALEVLERMKKGGFSEKDARRLLVGFYDFDADDYVSGSGYDPAIFTKILRNKLLDLESLDELAMVDRRTNTIVSHRDVGIGISQVLPVLVNAYACANKVIAIEQPEIHLHPGLQAELGDVFIESALGERKNTFIIETHSEHLLLRIMRRMRETATGQPLGIPIKPEDVMVLYVEPDGTRSIVREMPLNERGELVKAWPGGFFEEGLKEIF